MDQQYDLLRQVTGALERLGIRYFITGSTATIYYGEYRTTNDLDVVADIGVEHVAALCASFPAPDFYVSEEAVHDAALTRFQFNIIHVKTGLKVDVIIAATAFDSSELARACRISPEPGYEAWMISPEDIIVKKLQFYREGGSDKHLRDIAGVLRVNGPKLDREYIEQWAEKLGVRDLWEAVVRREKEMG